MSKRNLIKPRAIWLLALAVIAAMAALFSMLTPVAWATPPQDRAHQTVPTCTNTATIGPAGGSIAGDCVDNDVVFSVPPGALTQNYTFRIRLPSTSEMQTLPAGFAFVGEDNVIVEAIDATGNVVSPLNFNPAAMLSMGYETDDLTAAGGDPKNLSILFFNVTTNMWEELTPLTSDSVNKNVSAPVGHLTHFAMTAKVPTTVPVTGGDLDNTPVLALLSVLVLSLGVTWLVLKRHVHA